MQTQRIVLVLCSHFSVNNKAMSQSMVSNQVMTSYINVNEAKHLKQTKALCLSHTLGHIIKHSNKHNAHAVVVSGWHFNLLEAKRPHVFFIPFWLSSTHYSIKSRKCLPSLQMLRKLNCAATRFSKVAESRWIGQSPNSCCFIPSRPKNSSREDREPEATLRLARFYHFFGRPTQLLWRVRELCTARWDRSPCFRLKPKSFVGHIGSWRFRQSFAQQYNHMPKEHTLAHTHTHTANTWWLKHTLCTLSRQVQYR